MHLMVAMKFIFIRFSPYYKWHYNNLANLNQLH